MTDLGTEFGVEVSKDGATDTHVFVGEVQIVTGSGQGNSNTQITVVSAGQSAQLGPNKAISVGDEDAAESAKRFVRHMEMPDRQAAADAYAQLVLSMNPAVYYRMEKWPKGKDEDTCVLLDSAPGAHHGVLHQDRGFRPRVAGRFGSRRSTCTARVSATMRS